MRGLERSAAFWLRAYPPAWREQRGEEATALLLDLAPDGARRLDARTALGLLRGGIAARWRQTPPLRYYLPYRLFDLRVPAQYREWVRRDICSPGNARRNLMGRAWLLLLPLYGTAVAQDPRGFLSMWTVFGVTAVAMSLSVRSDAGERRRLQHHARPAPGGPRTLGEFVRVGVRATPDTAFVDLRHVAWTGRPVEVDRYDTELVPALVQEAR